jgi:hypothetical protein
MTFAYKPILAMVISKFSFGLFSKVNEDEFLTQEDFDKTIARSRQKIKEEMLENTIADNGEKIADAVKNIELEINNEILDKEIIKKQLDVIYEVLFPEPTENTDNFEDVSAKGTFSFIRDANGNISREGE